ncbi:hypothetical protein D3C73_1159210 [compost metagenome]
MTAMPRAKPTSSLIGKARISDIPARNANSRSHHGMGMRQWPVAAHPQSATANMALISMYSVAPRLSPCIISAGSYTAMNGTTKPANAMRTAQKLINSPFSLAMGAAAKQANATGGVRSARMPK